MLRDNKNWLDLRSRDVNCRQCSAYYNFRARVFRDKRKMKTFLLWELYSKPRRFVTFTFWALAITLYTYGANSSTCIARIASHTAYHTNNMHFCIRALQNMRRCNVHCRSIIFSRAAAAAEQLSDVSVTHQDTHCAYWDKPRWLTVTAVCSLN